MTIFLLVIQIGLPVMLLGWLAAYPAAGLCRLCVACCRNRLGNPCARPRRTLGDAAVVDAAPPLPLACSGRVKL